MTVVKTQNRVTPLPNPTLQTPPPPGHPAQPKQTLAQQSSAPAPDERDARGDIQATDPLEVKVAKAMVRIWKGGTPESTFLDMLPEVVVELTPWVHSHKEAELRGLINWLSRGKSKPSAFWLSRFRDSRTPSALVSFLTRNFREITRQYLVENAAPPVKGFTPSGRKRDYTPEESAAILRRAGIPMKNVLEVTVRATHKES